MSAALVLCCGPDVFCERLRTWVVLIDPAALARPRHCRAEASIAGLAEPSVALWRVVALVAVAMVNHDVVARAAYGAVARSWWLTARRVGAVAVGAV